MNQLSFPVYAEKTTSGISFPRLSTFFRFVILPERDADERDPGAILAAITVLFPSDAASLSPPTSEFLGSSLLLVIRRVRSTSAVRRSGAERTRR